MSDVMTTCCHGYKYEDCVFGCKLWQYTRTNRKHYINTESYDSYSDGPNWNLWVIADTSGCYSIAGSQGYDLYHKGKLIKHRKTVKKLKQIVMDMQVEAGGTK